MNNIVKRFGYYSKNIDDGMDFAVGKSDFMQYDEYSEVVRCIVQIKPVLIAIESVVLSYSELRECTKSFEDFTHKCGAPDTQYMNGLWGNISKIIAKVIAFLASASSFLSCTEVKIKSDFGKESQEIKSWNSCRNSLHKENFSYRFGYELRNYSQHYFLPVSSIGVSSENVQTENHVSKIEIRVDKQELFSGNYNWKKLKHEINACEEKFDLTPILQSYFGVLCVLAQEYFKLYERKIYSCYRYLEQLRRVHHFPDHGVPVIFMGDPLRPESFYENFECIPYSEINWMMSVMESISIGSKA
jgi:hypothetical protein